MYGPQGRARALLLVFASLTVCSATLALPFVFPEDAVRLRFDDGEGLRVQSGDPVAAPYLNADLFGPRPPRSIVAAPSVSGEVSFRVSWDNEGPDPAVPYTYHVQFAVVDTEGSGDAAEPADPAEEAWADWFTTRRSDLPRAADFTGMPGQDHVFRGRACDLARTCGPWSDLVRTAIVPEAVPVEVVLDLVPNAPLADQVLDGRVAIEWDYDHRGPGSALVEVLVVPHGGTAVPVYSGSGFSVVWDTTRHPDGAHEMHLRLSDGVHVVEERIPVTVRNHASAAAPTDDAMTAGSDPAATERRGGGDGQEAPGPAAVAVVALATLLCAVRRRRG